MGGTSAEERSDPRVLYAAERTLLAWMRTGLAMMGFGFVVARFGLFLRELVAAKGGESVSHNPRLSLAVGVALVLLGVVVNVAGAVRHHGTVRRLQPPVAADRRWSLTAAWLAVVLGVIGATMAGYLIYTR
jgi:putative membrane protein